MPTANTGKLIRAAIAGLRRIYRPGFEYAKAGVMLMDICQAEKIQYGLFEQCDSEKSERLMDQINILNRRYGRGTICYVQEGFKKDWRMRRRNITAAYTTSWQDLPEVR